MRIDGSCRPHLEEVAALVNGLFGTDYISKDIGRYRDRATKLVEAATPTRLGITEN